MAYIHGDTFAFLALAAVAAATATAGRLLKTLFTPSSQGEDVSSK